MSAASERTPALFLDRDGVINRDKGYVGRVEDFEFLPGIFELVRFAVRELGWPLVVVSNQSGIGRGYFDEAAYGALTDWMCECFRAKQAPIARVYHCPYHPTEGIGAYKVDHDWRKPKPGMILQAAADLNLDLSRSVLIGDKLEDMQAAAAAGVPLRIRIDASDARPPAGTPPHLVARNLTAALTMLRAQLVPARGASGLAQGALGR